MSPRKKIINRRVYVSESESGGHGLFAMQDFHKGEVIGYFGGKEIKFYIENTRDSLVGEHWLYLRKNTWLDVKTVERYTNHSCNPNAGVTGAVTLRAMRDIKKDDEIVMDYSTLEEDKGWYMKCGCNARNCRKMIRAIQFLPKEVYNKYGNFIPTYLKNKYDRR